MPLLPFSSSFLFASQAPDLKRSGAPMLIVLYHEDRANTCTVLPQSAKAKPCSRAGPSRGGILVAGIGVERRARTALRTACLRGLVREGFILGIAAHAEMIQTQLPISNVAKRPRNFPFGK